MSERGDQRTSRVEVGFTVVGLGGMAVSAYDYTQTTRPGYRDVRKELDSLSVPRPTSQDLLSARLVDTRFNQEVLQKIKDGEFESLPVLRDEYLQARTTLSVESNYQQIKLQLESQRDLPYHVTGDAAGFIFGIGCFLAGGLSIVGKKVDERLSARRQRRAQRNATPT